MPSAEDLVACSVATFAPKSFALFRSEIPGREKSQVGRWHPPNLEAYEQKQKNTVDSAVEGAASLPGHDGNWSDVWGMNDTWSGLPEGLSKSQWVTSFTEVLSIVLRDAIRDVQSLVYLSDDASEGLARSLDINFPHARKVGL